MAEQLFRKAALERQASPEQLDELMQVTTPKGWLVLLALGGLLAAAVLWGIYGIIPTRVTEEGILIKKGGIFDVLSNTAGQVTKTFVDVGEEIEEGQIIMSVAQHDLVEKIKEARENLATLKADHKRISRYNAEDIKKQTAYLADKRKTLKNSIRYAQDRLKWLQKRLTSQNQLFEEGLITKEKIFKTQQDIRKVRQEIEKSRNELENFSIQKLRLKEQKQREDIERMEKLRQAEEKLVVLEEELEDRSKVVSPYSGNVLEVLVDQGGMVSLGDSILILEPVGKTYKDLRAVFYVSPMEGKKVYTGMKVQISPSTVKQEEYGFMMGKVARVSEFPVTKKEMMKVLQNEELVKAFSEKGAPFEVYADLIVDPNTESGYKWSSPKGPPIKIHDGTICYSKVTVSEQRPVSLVIPLLKRYVLGVGSEEKS